jgi:hypothetical protein
MILACGNTKSSDVNNMPPPPPIAYMMSGTIQISNDDAACNLWIMTTQTSAIQGFYPVNLDDKYKIHGLQVKFNYEDSRAPLPLNCFNMKAIVITDIFEVK